jgi:hypothetical protein
LDHACKCFHLEEKVCGKLKFEAILGKFIFGCGSTKQDTIKEAMKLNADTNQQVQQKI